MRKLKLDHGKSTFVIKEKIKVEEKRATPIKGDVSINHNNGNTKASISFTTEHISFEEDQEEAVLELIGMIVKVMYDKSKELIKEHLENGMPVPDEQTSILDAIEEANGDQAPSESSEVEVTAN